jgi:hypothetical protein
MKNDKWSMFKNYMHNELGITKEDIRQWVDDAVREQAEKMVQNEFKSFSTEGIIKKLIFSDDYFSSKSMKREITAELSKQLLEKFEFKND